MLQWTELVVISKFAVTPKSPGFLFFFSFSKIPIYEQMHTFCSSKTTVVAVSDASWALLLPGQPGPFDCCWPANCCCKIEALCVDALLCFCVWRRGCWHTQELSEVEMINFSMLTSKFFSQISLRRVTLHYLPFILDILVCKMLQKCANNFAKPENI